MAKKSAKAKGPRRRLTKLPLPKRQPGAWSTAEPFYPKNAPPDIVTEFKLEPANKRAVCTRKAGGKYGKVSNVLRACHVELDFSGTSGQLRFCTTAGKPGPTIAVTTHAEATALSREFCACSKTSSRAVCARKITAR